MHTIGIETFIKNRDIDIKCHYLCNFDLMVTSEGIGKDRRRRGRDGERGRETLFKSEKCPR